MTSSAQRKLARGVERVKTLRAEAEAFISADAYVFEVEREDRSPQEVVYRCFATERHPLPDHWPLLAGEAIQNLRSSLDHAVWSAWRAVPGNSGSGDHTKFPIATDSSGFASQAGAGLRGVPKPIRTLIEEAQPYKISPQAPARDRLQLLRTLSNVDKHRTLATVASAIAFEMIGLDAGFDLTWDEMATGKPLGPGKTQISRYTVRATGERKETKVEPKFTYEIRIETMSLDILSGIVRRVFETVGEIETGEPKSPSATYPI